MLQQNRDSRNESGEAPQEDLLWLHSNDNMTHRDGSHSGAVRPIPAPIRRPERIVVG